jgi:hypothetical protein
VKIEEVYHLAAITDELLPACRAHLTPHVSPLPTLDRPKVNCPDCLRIIDQRPLTLGEYWAAGQAVHYIRTVDWAAKNSAPYRCGAMTGHASTSREDVTCSDCLDLLDGGWDPNPLHTPPRMENANGLTDGVFTFHDTHIQGATLEVVPQTTGNVEISITYGPDDGYLFTLHHLDRADLLRALLHDFHYSPERGGPHDETD